MKTLAGTLGPAVALAGREIVRFLREMILMPFRLIGPRAALRQVVWKYWYEDR